MPTLVADEYDDISRRLREIEAERCGGGDPAPVALVVFAIWYEPSGKSPGWIWIKSPTNWAIHRMAGEDVTCFESADAAQHAIDTKRSGSFDTSRMRPREYAPA